MTCPRPDLASSKGKREAGATGLEPATSGVTGRVSAATILHGATRKRLNSWGFDSASSVSFNDLARASPAVPPHPGPIAAFSRKTFRVRHLQWIFVMNADGSGQINLTNNRRSTRARLVAQRGGRSRTSCQSAGRPLEHAQQDADMLRPVLVEDHSKFMPFRRIRANDFNKELPVREEVMKASLPHCGKSLG